MISNKGYTILEMIIATVVIGISALLLVNWQKLTWSKTANANRLMVAGHVIEKQVEKRRMIISKDKENNYAAFKALTDTTIIDNSISPPIKVLWNISPAYDFKGVEIGNVRSVDLTSSWGAIKSDTLRVKICIAKDF